jgi:hypothetical protein
MSNYYVPFNKVILPFFETLVNLDLVGTVEVNNQKVDLLSQLTDETFIKRAVYGNFNFFEQALTDNQEPHVILAIILKGRLYQSSPEFKELAEKLLDKINSTGVPIDEKSIQIYNALNATAVSPLSGKRFSPANLEAVKNAVIKQNKIRQDQSALYLQSKVEASLRALGYTDVTYNGLTGSDEASFRVDFYSPSTNTVFLTLDSANLNYDRKTPNGLFRLRECIAKNLPGSPKVHIINVFELGKNDSAEDKVKYLQE